MFAALVTTGAFIKISIPVQPFSYAFYPAVLFCSAGCFCTGRKLGSASVLAYLVIGLVGVPSLRQEADGLSGAPDLGFLLGFCRRAYTTGTLSERLHRHTFLNLLAAAFAGMMVMYLSGCFTFILSAIT